MASIDIKILQAGPITWEIKYGNDVPKNLMDSNLPIFCLENNGRDILWANTTHTDFFLAYGDVLVNGQKYCVINCSNQAATVDIYNNGNPQQIVLLPGESNSFVQSETTNPPVVWTGETCTGLVAFDYTGTTQSYQISEGCWQISCWGADGFGVAGGKGGFVQGTFYIDSAKTLEIGVGQGGQSVSGSNGYGIVDGGSRRGGAGTYVSDGTPASSFVTLVVAGGGGGNGSEVGGAFINGGLGGGTAGEDGTDATRGGKGANGLTAGAGGVGAVNGASGSFGNGGNGAFFGGGGGGLGGGGGGAQDPEGQSMYDGSGGGGSGGFATTVPLPGFINVQFDDPDYITKPLAGTNGYVQIQSVVCPCVAEGTLVRLASGREVCIETLKEGAIVQDIHRQAIRISNLIKFQIPAKQFVKIPASSLSKNIPSGDLFIREGHPFIFKGREVLPEDLVGKCGIGRVSMENAKFIYSLITDRRCFIDMQGLMVATWSICGWENAVENDNRVMGHFTLL